MRSISPVRTAATTSARRVLVVEDHPLVQETTRALLEEAGCTTLVARNADEALAILARRDDVDAMFTDVDMPGSMDGVDLARLVHHRWPAIRTVVTSGGAAPRVSTLPDRVRFHPKPYDAEAVLGDLLGR